MLQCFEDVCSGVFFCFRGDWCISWCSVVLCVAVVCCMSGLVVFIVECVVVVVMADNGCKMVEDVVDVVVFVEYCCLVLWVGGLAIRSSNIEYGFVVSISSWRLRSGPRRSVSDCPLINEIMSFSKMLSSRLLSIWLSMICEKLRRIIMRQIFVWWIVFVWCVCYIFLGCA